MLFNSVSFAIFLPIIFIIYWICPERKRWFVLLLASYYFYMGWSIKYVSLIFLTTAVSYLCARLLERYQKWRKGIVFLVAFVCLGILFFFKYYNFFWETMAAIVAPFSIQLHPTTLKLVLPVGISFYTFQTLSYVTDVYRGKIKAERNFLIYATYISFFPQLVAGPIERADKLMPQIKEVHHFNYEQGTYGLKLMAWGFFKKIVIADTFAVYVDRVFADVTSFHGFTFVAAIMLFTIQIYCDFSGYSDIARGTAKLFGIELMNNFESPYFSTSISEYWRRWHISLSSWLQDYVYIPLGGSRKGKWRKRLNLILTFLISGLWHGANKTYVLWGGVHGLCRVLEDCIPEKKSQKVAGIWWWIKVLITFSMIAAMFIIFRSNRLTDVYYIMTHLLDGIKNPNAYLYAGLVGMNIGKDFFMKATVMVLLLALFDYTSLKLDVIAWIGKQKGFVRWSIYVALIMLIICWGSFGTSSFIYFQF